MRTTALIIVGLLLASCGPAGNAKLPVASGGGGAGSTGGSSASGGTSGAAGSAGGAAGTSGAGGSTNPFGGSSGGNTAGTGGKAGSGGSGGSAGSGGSGGNAGSGGSGGSGGGTSKPDGSGIPDLPIPPGVAEPCTEPRDFSEGQTGPFGTEGALCFRTCDEIEGWGCSSFDGRTVKVNGKDIECGSKLPGKLGPFYYFEASAGSFPYAAIYWWGKSYGVPAGGFKKWDGSSSSPSTPDAGADDSGS